MDETFRQRFLVKFLKNLEHQTNHIKAIELGVLHERYSELCKNTPKKLRARVFEQVSLGILLWIACSADNLYTNDDIAFMNFLNECKISIGEIVRKYTENQNQ